MRSRPANPAARRARLRSWVPATLLLAVASAAPTARAQTGEGWGQFQGGSTHLGVAAGGVAAPYREAWRFDPGLTGRFGVSAPVVAGDVAVTVGPRAVYGVDLATGSTSWEIPRAYGPSVAPAVAEGGILVYTEGFGEDPPEEAFASTSPSDGVSPSATPGDGGVSPTPTQTGTPTTSGQTGDETTSDTSVVAVDLATQEPVWDAPVRLQAVSRTGVTVDGDTAYVGDDDGTVTAIETSTGEFRWTFDAPAAVATTIAADADTVVLSTQPEENDTAAIIALHAEDGSEAWRSDAGGIGPFLASVPSIQGDTVYLGVLSRVGSDVRALSIDDGSERWTRTASGRVSPFTAPIVTSDAIVVIDGLFGQVVALDPSTGEVLWDYALNTLAPAGPVLSDGTLVVTTARGSLLGLDVASHDLVSQTAAAGPQGYLGAMAVTSQMVVAIKGGHRPGLVAFEHDADTPLLAQASPTVLEPLRMVGAFALAAIPLVVLLAIVGRWLARRMGPAFADDEEPLGDGPLAETDA